MNVVAASPFRGSNVTAKLSWDQCPHAHCSPVTVYGKTNCVPPDSAVNQPRNVKFSRVGTGGASIAVP